MSRSFPKRLLRREPQERSYPWARSRRWFGFWSEVSPQAILRAALSTWRVFGIDNTSVLASVTGRQDECNVY